MESIRASRSYPVSFPKSIFCYQLRGFLSTFHHFQLPVIPPLLANHSLSAVHTSKCCQPWTLLPIQVSWGTEICVSFQQINLCSLDCFYCSIGTCPTCILLLPKCQFSSYFWIQSVELGGELFHPSAHFASGLFKLPSLSHLVSETHFKSKCPIHCLSTWISLIVLLLCIHSLVFSTQTLVPRGL